MIPGKPFDPATETSRRPTPEKFAPLKKWIQKVEKNIKITSIEELCNINNQLLQTAELYVSNIISRVIAQIIGKYGDGFVTIEATVDGKLKVEAAIPAGDTIGLDAGANLIGKVEIAGSSQTLLQAKIDFATAATHSIIAAVAGKKNKVTNIMLTVAGETNLTLQSAGDAISGALDFGGTDEPRGMVHALGSYPLETAVNEAFQITSSLAVQVSGYVTYYRE